MHYEIYSANDYPNAGWPVREVILKREDLFVKIYEERGELELSFGSPSHGYINVGSKSDKSQPITNSS